MKLNSNLSRVKADCSSCPLNGGKTVPGNGKRNGPKIAFIGEAPGEHEVLQGKPFVGKAGQFLRRVIRDLGIDESQCYFSNACLCRPPGNSAPNAKAITACSNRLLHELAEIRPNLIVTLGGIANRSVLQSKLTITHCRGSYQELALKDGTRVGVIPTYHPSGVLRTPDLFLDFVDDLDFAKQVSEGSTPVIEPPYENYVVIDTQHDFKRFLSKLSAQKWTALDLETTGLDWFTGEILCAGFSWKRGHAWILDWQTLIRDNPDNLHALDDAFSSVKLIFQNGTFDMSWLLRAGLRKMRYALDVQAVHYLLDERQGTHSLSRLATKYYRAPDYKTRFRESIGIRTFIQDEQFGEAIARAPKRDLLMYNGADADYTYRLAVDLIREAKKENQLPILWNIEMPAARLFLKMHIEGIPVDKAYLERMGNQWSEQLLELEAKMRSFKGAEKINFGSPKQLASYLFDELKLAPFGGREMLKRKTIPPALVAKDTQTVEDPEARHYWATERTQASQTDITGERKIESNEGVGMNPRTTSTYVLYWLKQQHPFPALLIKYREIKKLKNMYYDGLKKHIWEDGKVHPIMNLTATRTGRKITSRPALSNLPRGSVIYNLFVAPPNWVIVHADYSQAELRLMAHLSGDENLIEILNTSDIHTVVAKQLYHLSDEQWENMSDLEHANARIAAKTIVFGIPYGRSAESLAIQLGLTKKQAQSYINTYYGMMKDLKDWIVKQRANAVKTQMAISPWNRRRRFPLIVSRWHSSSVAKQGGNMPIQSGISDLTLLAQIRIAETLEKKGIPYHVWPNIYDSFNFCVPKSLWKPVVQLTNDIMMDIPFETNVLFPAEISVGKKWGSLKVVMAKGEWVVSSKA